MTAWPERSEEEESVQQASYPTFSLRITFFSSDSSDGSVGSALDPAPLHVTECPAVTTGLKK